MASEFSDRWIRWRQNIDLSDYESKWERLEAQGKSIHGEANFLCRLLDPAPGQLVMDAGCGSGRVGLELARRGFSVVGVDNDPDMLALARPKTENDPVLSQSVRWELADLSTFSAAEAFDMIALAGNVLVFAKPEARKPAVANLSAHLKPGGLFVAGSESAPGYDFEVHGRWCEEVGLEPVSAFSTWDEDPYDGGRYSVSVFRRPVEAKQQGRPSIAD